MDTEKRFWEKVSQKSEDECWNWNAGTDGTERGAFSFHGKPERAYRVAWILTNGEIPDGMSVCHKCDNPRCCNPKHLFIGTQADNALDMWNKGRGASPRGERNGRAKLTTENILEIRQLSAQGLSSRKIASRMDVSKTQINEVLKGNIWKHVR